MLARVEFTIPGRPVAWARAGHNPKTGGAMHFTPHKQRDHMKVVQGYYREVTRALNHRLSGALKLEVLAVYAIPKGWPKVQQEAARRGLVWKTSVPDWDNLGKIISDALNAIAYADDAAIALASIGKRYGHPERTVIRITELESWQDALARSESPEPPRQAALL